MNVLAPERRISFVTTVTFTVTAVGGRERRRVKCGCIGDIIKVALCPTYAFRLNYFRDFQEFSRRRRGSAAGPYLCMNIWDLKNVRCTLLKMCALLNAFCDTVHQIFHDKRDLVRYAYTFMARVKVRKEDKNRMILDNNVFIFNITFIGYCIHGI